MNWVIYLFGSGILFFVGVGLILIGVAIFTFTKRGWAGLLASLSAVVGIILIILSAIRLPYWLYGLAGAACVLWLVAERVTWIWLVRWRKGLRGLVVAACAVALAVELPYHFSPTVTATGHPKLYIIGDSVTAGVGGEKVTWPRLLTASHPVEVVDLSRAGATAASALRQAEKLPPDGGGLVLLEIGGNDVLGSTSAPDFEHTLDKLLERVCRPGRVVLMFELPLPPFCNEFGMSQRRLASRHGVALIPRRIFATVLTAEEATLDSIHLSRAGHERMAEVVWEIVQPTYQ